MTRRTAWLVLVGLLVTPAPADVVEGEAPEESPLGVRVGFGGYYKVGVWTPVEVTFRGRGRHPTDKVVVTVPDGDGVPSRVRAVFSGDETSVTVYTRFGRVESELAVEIEREGKVIARRVLQTTAALRGAGVADSRPGAIAATRQMIVSVAADPLGVEGAVGLRRQAAGQRSAAVRLKDAGQLPQQWHGYEGVDTLVLSTSRPKIYSDLTPGSPQIEALEQWVQMGGKLILCVGSQAEEFHGGDGLLTPLSRFLPGRLQTNTVSGKEKVTIVELRQMGELETYCASLVPIPPQDPGDVAEVPKLSDVHVDGMIEAREADLPLVVRAPRGLGQIVFFAGDLDREPLSRWADRPRLVGRLLGLPAAETEEPESRDQRFDDLAAQLRSALDRFADVRVVPFWVVVVLIVVYILLIGPGDYFFLRKVARRMEWTWLTFPLIVLLFCIGAYVAAHRLKGDRVRINQVDLVDVDCDPHAQSGLVRGTSWMSIFSPRAQSFNLSLRPKLPDGTVPRHAKATLAWLGLPGGALGGMDPRTSDPVLWTEGYDFSPELDAMQNVPIPIWSTKSLTARWTARTRACPTAELVEEGRFPVGRITNTLSFPLSKCFLVYGRYAYTLKTRDNQDDPGRLGTLQPRESTAVDAWTWRSELKTVLNGQSSRTQPDQAPPGDRAVVELPDILQAMMFFEATGGRPYAGAGNGYQDFVDLTHLLKTNRAILVAQGPGGRGQPGHGADLLCEDRNDQPITAEVDQHVTIYRFVFPVGTGPPE